MLTIERFKPGGLARPSWAAQFVDLRKFGADLVATVPRHYPMVVCIIIYLSISASLARVFSVERSLTLGTYAANLDSLAKAFVIIFVLGLSAHVARVMLFDQPRRLTRRILGDFRFRIFTNKRIAQSILIFLLMPLFMTAYTSLKALIPLLHPFSWDPIFSQWDLWIHGGYHPWQLLHPLIGQPLISYLINVIYNFWFYVVFGVMAWQAASLRDPRLRLQFLLSFVLTWALLGSLAATVFSSAGPVYFGRVTGLADIYEPLMAYLHAANEVYPIWALGVQEALWSKYELSISSPGSGISAMPSMHIATSVLFTLLAWRTHRMLGIAFTLFTSVIFVGSIHLGWHYAVDGYLAIAATCLIWTVVGRALVRSEKGGSGGRVMA